MPVPTIKLKRKLTLNQFTKIVQKATAEQLRQLAPEYLPDNIPDDLVDEAPYETRMVVENLIFEGNNYQVKLAMEVDGQYGSDVNDALHIAKERTESKTQMHFKKEVTALVSVYKNNKAQKDIFASQSFVDSLEKAKAMLFGLREEYGALMRSVYVLEKIHASLLPKHMMVFENAVDIAYKRIKDIELSTNLYYYVSIMLATDEMHRVRDQIVKLESEATSKRTQIDSKRKQLRKMKEGLFKRKSAKGEAVQIQNDITQLVGQLQSYEALICEKQLLSWLDTVVESSLSGYVQTQSETAVRTARLALFGLLHKYCTLQEESAKQVARNPFSQVDPKQSIRFILRSEQFILNYFSNKKSDVTAWLGGAAEQRIQSLNKLERALLGELRRNIRALC